MQKIGRNIGFLVIMSLLVMGMRDSAHAQIILEQVSEKRLPAPELSENEELSEEIMKQVELCWQLPRLEPRIYKPVSIHADYDIKGELVKADLSDENKPLYATDANYKMLADSALAAVKKCSPIQAPKDKFAVWQYVDLHFYAKDAKP